MNLRIARIADNLFALGTVFSAVYCLNTDEGLILIDTGAYWDRRRILRQLRQLFGQPLRFRAVLLTHAHLDHDGNALFLQRHFGAKIVCSPVEGAYAQKVDRVDRTKFASLPLGGRLFLKFMMRITPQPLYEPDQLVQDGELIYGFRVYDAPGHTPGSLIYRHEASNTLFSGDTLLNAIPPWTFQNSLAMPEAAFASDYQQVLNSLARLHEIPFDNLAPGHGPPIIGQADQKIRAFLAGKKRS
jgi:glyoxylase-like metal-dependent hydrolase (beta-lactamase superfamily II)